MSNYVIKGFLNNQIALQLDDGTIRNFPLPVQPDGTYLTGDALNSLLGTYANNAVLTTTTSDVVLGTNISEILGLIQVTDREIELAWKKIISTVKGTRNTLMKYTDKTQLGDFPGLTPELKDSWNVYRQQLRDLTSQTGYPLNVVWPVPPGVIWSTIATVCTETDGSPLCSGYPIKFAADTKEYQRLLNNKK